jgi:hypothetical protein
MMIEKYIFTLPEKKIIAKKSGPKRTALLLNT